MVPGLGKRKTGLLKREPASQQNSQERLESVKGSSQVQDVDFVGTADVDAATKLASTKPHLDYYGEFKQ